MIYEIIWRHKEHNIACPSFMFTCSQMLTWLIMRGNYNVLIYIHQLHMMGTLCKIRSTLVKPCVFKNNYFFSNKYMNSIMSKYLISYMQLNNNTRYLSRVSIVSNIPFPPQLFKQLWLPVYSFAWWSRSVGQIRACTKSMTNFLGVTILFNILAMIKNGFRLMSF